MLTFDAWVRQTIQPAFGPEFTATPDNLDWLRGIHANDPDIEADSVEKLHATELLRLANGETGKLQHDVRATSSNSPSIEAGIRGGLVVLLYNGNSTHSYQNLNSLNKQTLLGQMATALQTEYIEEFFTYWPLCPRDNAYLRPEVVNHVAVWMCALGNHDPIPVGSL